MRLNLCTDFTRTMSIKFASFGTTINSKLRVDLKKTRATTEQLSRFEKLPSESELQEAFETTVRDWRSNNFLNVLLTIICDNDFTYKTCQKLAEVSPLWKVVQSLFVSLSKHEAKIPPLLAVLNFMKKKIGQDFENTYYEELLLLIQQTFPDAKPSENDEKLNRNLELANSIGFNVDKTFYWHIISAINNKLPRELSSSSDDSYWLSVSDRPLWWVKTKYTLWLAEKEDRYIEALKICAEIENKGVESADRDDIKAFGKYLLKTMALDTVNH